MRWRALMLAALMAIAAAPAIAGGPLPAVATDARLVGDSERTRLVVDLSRTVTLDAFTLADPYRVVVDIPDIAFSLPAANGQEGRGLVSAYRFGLFAPGRGRLVIDANAPVAIDRAFVLEPIDDQPARLVIDLVRTDRAKFLKSASVAVRRPDPAAGTPPAIRHAAAADRRPMIVIDPGHGGVDSGAVNIAAGIAEKVVVLGIAGELRDRLTATGRYQVALTREDDSFVPLGDRVRIARERHAELFISLHADSLSGHDTDVRGATIYTLADHASDAEAQRLADDENRADLISGLNLSEEPADVADILFDLAQRETRNFSSQFARTLAGQVSGAARMHKSPLKSAGFKVLRAPDVPSVLFELGYLSSRKDLELMTSAAWRSKVTEAMVEAIDAYFTALKPLRGEAAALPVTAAEAMAGTVPVQPAAIRP